MGMLAYGIMSEMVHSALLNMNAGGNAVPQEVALLKGLSYDRNIVQFYGVCPQPGGEPPLLVLEYMAGEKNLTQARRNMETFSARRYLLCVC